MALHSARRKTANVIPIRETKSVIECQDNLDFMRSLKKGSMDLIVTSPPYNIGKEYESEPLSIFTSKANRRQSRKLSAFFTLKAQSAGKSETTLMTEKSFRST